MALLLSSRDIGRRAAEAESLVKHIPALVPTVAAAAGALGSTAFLRMMKPGGWKTIAGVGAVAGGGYMSLFLKGGLLRGAGVGISAGGLWSLFMKT